MCTFSDVNAKSVEKSEKENTISGFKEENMSNKSCYYLCLVGCLPDKDECKKKHPEGCEGCDLYLEDPTPATTPVSALNLRNLNVEVSRMA